MWDFLIMPDWVTNYELETENPEEYGGGGAEMEYAVEFLGPAVIRICAPWLQDNRQLNQMLGYPLMIAEDMWLGNAEGYRIQIQIPILGKYRQALATITFRHTFLGWYYIEGMYIDFLDGRTEFIALPKRARWLDYRGMLMYLDCKQHDDDITQQMLDKDTLLGADELIENKAPRYIERKPISNIGA